VKRIEGVAVGLVKEVDAKLGRVRVSFPWLDSPQKSYWAPIAAPLSGKKRGMRFMPEQDDEALVAFDRGEFDHPYVVGFLWNGADEAPDDEKNNRVVVTPGGHELRFEDKDGDRRIVLKSSNGHELELDDKAGKVTLATKNGGKVVLEDAPGTAVVEASQNKISIGPGGITIDVTSGVLNVNASAAVNLQAQGPLNVTASSAVNVQASGLVNVTASVLSVSAPVAMFSGLLVASTVVATSIVSPAYSPGAGNIL
jgi:uncharacterized protein involved in type VI secretion and phage assembly